MPRCTDGTCRCAALAADRHSPSVLPLFGRLPVGPPPLRTPPRLQEHSRRPTCSGAASLLLMCPPPSLPVPPSSQFYDAAAFSQQVSAQGVPAVAEAPAGAQPAAVSVPPAMDFVGTLRGLYSRHQHVGCVAKQRGRACSRAALQRGRHTPSRAWACWQVSRCPSAAPLEVVHEHGAAAGRHGGRAWEVWQAGVLRACAWHFHTDALPCPWPSPSCVSPAASTARCPACRPTCL